MTRRCCLTTRWCAAAGPTLQRELPDPRLPSQPEPRYARGGAGCGAGLYGAGRGVVSVGLLLPARWDSTAQVGPDGSPGAMHNPHDRTEDRYLSVRPRSLASAQPADAQRRQVLLLSGDPPGGLHPGEVPAGPVSPGPKHLLPGQWQHDLW